MDIKTRVKEILLEHMEYELSETEIKKMLIADNINIPPRELVLLFFDIEKQFGIIIDEEYVLNGSFKTYEGICKMIYELTNCIETCKGK